MLYVTNAFSVNMILPLLHTDNSVAVRFERIELEAAKTLLNEQPFVSAIGHSSTAQLLSTLLGVDIPENRTAITLTKTDTILIAQITVRPPEGHVYSYDELMRLYADGKIQFVLCRL